MKTTTSAHLSFNPVWICGLAALFVSLAGTEAFAGPLPVEPYSVNVAYYMQDLATEQGAEKVYRKLKKAARKVCFATSEPWDGARTRHYWECYETALAKAVSDVNSRNLTALYQQQEDKSDGKRKRPS